MAEDFSLKIIACETLQATSSRSRSGVEIEYARGCCTTTRTGCGRRSRSASTQRPGERTILLGYGRCSNGLAGLRAGRHRLVLPAVDDCISLLLGSRAPYLEQFTAQPGTYYYTRGWIEYIDDPYHEYLEMIPKYGRRRRARSPI